MQDSQRKYTITKPLGRGGMGQVWAALKHGAGGMQMPCAIKVLWPALAMTEEDCERFYREARIAAQLDHGRIVKVIDTTIVQGSPSLIMEWVDGVNLRVLLEKAQAAGTLRVGVDVSLYVVGEILAALAYAHSRTVAGEDAGVIHSDVTPGNILISSSGEVKLTDFGIARFVKTSDKTLSRAVGTPRYMAPEQLRGRIYTATDIYGLGVVLHELLEGERYLSDCSGEEFQFQVLSGYVPTLTQPDIPDWVDTLRRRMLSSDPDERPTAEDAHAMIVERANNYALAALELKRLYLRSVGKPSSGFTDLLELRHGGDAGMFFASVFGQEAGAAPAPESASRDSPTREEAPVAAPALAKPADPDAPSVLRRAGRSPLPQGTRETIEHTNTGAAAWTEDDEPACEPTLRLPDEDGAAVVSAQPSSKPAEPTPDRTMPFTPAFLQRGVRKPGASEARPSPVGGRDDRAQHEATGEVLAAPEAPSESVVRVRYLALAAGAAALLFAGVFLASMIMNWTGAWEDAGAPVAQRAPQPHAEQGPPSQAAVEVAEPPKPEPQPSEPPSASPATEAEAEVQPASLQPAAGPEHEASAPEPSAFPAEPEPKPKPKPKPKPDPEPKREPAVKVSFLILASPRSGSKSAQIEAGRRSLSTDNKFKSTNLRPGSYPIRWRWGTEGPWHQLGTLRIDEGLPAGSYYAVKLHANEMEVSKTVKGGTK